MVRLVPSKTTACIATLFVQSSCQPEGKTSSERIGKLAYLLIGNFKDIRGSTRIKDKNKFVSQNVIFNSHFDMGCFRVIKNLVQFQ